MASPPKYPRTIGDMTFKGLGDLIKLLPTGTIFLFQFINPLLTDAGRCTSTSTNRYLSMVFLAACGFSCCFSSFTDSYIGIDGRVYYGVATRSGLWSFSDVNAGSVDMSKYKLRFGDFVHALVSLGVFAVIALLDENTVNCLYPVLDSQEQTMQVVLTTVMGGLASSVFMVFPNNRHGIGYPAAPMPMPTAPAAEDDSD